MGRAETARVSLRDGVFISLGAVALDMGEDTNGASGLNLIGGRLCLDFANTADWHAGPHPRELLRDLASLKAWGLRAGALTEVEAGQAAAGEARSAEAEAVPAGVIDLREAIYRIFSAVAAGGRPAQADLDRLNAVLRQAAAHAELVPADSGYAWRWRGGGSLDLLLWRVARSAADLLTSPDLGRVRRCQDAMCGWLFLDTSKNQSRKWCTMASCGNRAKARRHYERRTKK